MPRSNFNRAYADAKLTPQHNSRIRLPPRDIPIPPEDRNVVPCICCPASLGWYVFTTVPQGERRAATSLKREGYTTYVPCETGWRKGSSGRGDREFQRPIFRGYLFVGIDAGQPWYPLREKNAWGQNKHGLLGVLSLDGKPFRLTGGAKGGPLNDLMRLAARESAGLDDSAVIIRAQSGEVPFRKGDDIAISDGPFASCSGAITDVDAHRLRLTVEVSIFGRATPVALDFAQVENLTRRSSRTLSCAKSA